MLRRNEFDLMSERSKLTRHMMSASTRFHHDRAGMKRGEEIDQLLAVHLLAKHCLPTLILEQSSIVVYGRDGMIRRPALEEPVCFQSPGFRL